MHINCPDLKVGAIENQPLTGLLPQASLRGAQNKSFLDWTHNSMTFFLYFRDNNSFSGIINQKVIVNNKFLIQ